MKSFGVTVGTDQLVFSKPNNGNDSKAINN